MTIQQNICVGGYPAKGQRGIRTRATKLKSRVPNPLSHVASLPLWKLPFESLYKSRIIYQKTVLVMNIKQYVI